MLYAQEVQRPQPQDQWTIISTTSAIIIFPMIKNSCGKDVIHCQTKTWTKRDINLKHTCPFYSYISFDSIVFIVVPDLGKKTICITTNKLILKVAMFLNPENKYQMKMKIGC